MSLRVCAFLITIAAATTLAAQTEVTPFAGWQGGGALSIRNENAPLNDGPVVGMFLSFDRGPDRRLDVLFARQTTHAERNDPFEDPVSESVEIDYLQLGGRYFVSRSRRADPYIGATIGGTRVAAAGASAVTFSFTAAVGLEVPLSRALALRLDGRVYTTLAGSDTRIGCESAGNCTAFSSGSTLTQVGATAGLVVKF